MRAVPVRRLAPRLMASMAAVLALLVMAPAANATSQPTSTLRSPHPTSKSAVPLNTRLTTVAFLNSSRGYGVFNVVGNVTCADRVGLTTNAGATFTIPVQVISWRCAAAAPASELSFDNHGDGFLYGPELFITHDHGASWNPAPQHGEVLSVEALGDSIWMLETSRHVSSSAPSDSKVALRLLSSTNGGRTWSVLPTPSDAEARPANSGGSGWLVRINRTSAYLASSPAQRNGAGAHSTPLWMTTNSGATWSSRTIPCASFGTSMALSVAPGASLFDVCASEPSAGTQLKETVRSMNEGRTWQVRSMCHFSPTNVLRCTPGSQFSGYVSEIDAVSNRTLYLVGDRSSLMVSRNGGTSWSVDPPGLGGDSGGTSQAIFFSSSHGIVLGDNDQDNELPTLWSTTDGGAHWSVRVPQYK
jgi:photosystem II stability/assembly factor-like uncharacterized protein